MSSLWGSLSKKNTYYRDSKIYENDKEKQKNTLIYDIIYKTNGDEIYKLFFKDNLYNYNIRIKPFLTSLARVNIAKVSFENLDNVIRIYCDNATFSSPIDYSKFNLLNQEEKTSGMIRWNSNTNYEHIE